MCQSLEDRYNKTNFLQMTNKWWIKNHESVKNCIHWPVEFNIIEYEKFIDIIPDFTFKELPLAEFWYNIKKYP